MNNKTYSIDLTLKELNLIDGKVSNKAQETINKAKQENSYGFELPIMNEILRKSEETRELKWEYKTIKECKYCDKKYSYHKYPKNGKYHNKGDICFDKPIYYKGIEFNKRQGNIICWNCETKYNIIHRLIDYIINNDLKIQIQKNDYKPSKYLKDKIQICYKCNKEMKESEMGNIPTIIGDEYYKGICPHCGAKAEILGKKHKITNRFDVILNPEFKDEVQKINKLVKQYNKNIEQEDSINIFQSKKDNNKFIIRENKWNNGRRQVINFDINKKVYEIGYFWKDKADLFTDVLRKYNYKQI